MRSYVQNPHKLAQWKVVAEAFSFGNIEYKLTGSAWARSGFLGLVFLNEMLLEAWVQIVLQIINNSESNNWEWQAIVSLVLSIVVIMVNIFQFLYKHRQNLLFGLAGGMFARIGAALLGLLLCPPFSPELCIDLWRPLLGRGVDQIVNFQ